MASPNISTDNIANLLCQRNALEQINAFKSQTSMFADVAKIQADIIKGCVNELQQLMNKLSPFMVEKCDATVLVATKEAQNSVKEINDGLATLSMYTGGSIELIEVKRGKSAELTLEDFVWQQNMRFSVSSKLICNTYKMASEEAVPYCWTYSWRRATYGNDGNTLTRPPVDDYEIVQVQAIGHN